ncbi:NAD-dependent epimerase/dehydratase family protein [Nocardia wallacei]|uniref:NAD-dependent epimerase/dehydratase family protein n=1 Tax=Nocardia wallacei TaxID=480035 RepID=UPI002456DC55|nr:NAD-dependent epimerase/dehydratase family protein [Nocardia wallacei]
MKALVTGASGFLGGALVRRLVRDGACEVAILVRPTSNLRDLGTAADRVERITGDLTDPGSLDRAASGVDVVFHSAARVDERGTRDQFWAANVRATERLLASARAGGASRFVFVSSPSALMDRDGGDQVDIDESVPYPRHYLNHYCESKAAAERLMLAANAPVFTTCALRPRAIWGAGDRSGPIVWRFLARVATELGYRPPSRKPDPRLVRSAVAVIETFRRVPFVAARWTPPLSRYTVAVMTRTGAYDTSAAARDFGYLPVVDRDTGMAELQKWLRDEGVLPGLTAD